MRFQVVPAAYVFLRRSEDGVDQVLLQLREGTGFMDGHWAAAAAGHVEAGESVLEAAVREAAEEAGIRVDPVDLEPVTTLHRFERGGPQVEQRCDWFFAVRRWSGDPGVAEPDKAVEMRWFPLGALPGLVVPHERLVLDGLRDGTLPAVVSLPS